MISWENCNSGVCLLLGGGGRILQPPQSSDLRWNEEYEASAGVGTATSPQCMLSTKTWGRSRPHSSHPMNPNLQTLVNRKNQWMDPLSAHDEKKGFKAWYASKNLPHCDLPGVRQFISYRLADSMPVALRGEWEMFFHLKDEQDKQRKIQGYLDRGLGECHLRDSRVSDMVQENLWHHDGVKYRLLAWVLMPNHVHVLIEIWDTPLAEILQSWKGYTARKANLILNRNGVFWAEDYFDRRIRDEEHCQRVIHYVESNPIRAKLVRAPEDWKWCSARYRSKEDMSLTHPNAGRNPPPPI